MSATAQFAADATGPPGSPASDARDTNGADISGKQTIVTRIANH
jgi:hypothetical protein